MSNTEDLIKKLEEENKKLKEANLKMAAHIENLTDEITNIINDSQGVSGYHLNGDVANWEEFDILNLINKNIEYSLYHHNERVFINGYIEGACEHSPEKEPEPNSLLWMADEAYERYLEKKKNESQF